MMNKKYIFTGLVILLAIGLLLCLIKPSTTLAQTIVSPSIQQGYTSRFINDLHHIEAGFAAIPSSSAPVAMADYYEVAANTTLTVDAVHGVLANDIDADGDTLTAQILGSTSHGTLTLYPDGSFVYIPVADYVGADYFTYQASDGLYISSPAKVTINVTSASESVPVALADTYETATNTTLTVDTEHGVLANDIDADGDPLTAQILGSTSHGTLTLYADGSFVYVPATDYAGADYFTYQASDGLYLSNPARVTINVTSAGESIPVALADTYEVQSDTTLTVDVAEGVLANDIDADGDDLTAQILGGASHGILTLYADGSFVYVPDLGYVGADYFTYQAFDGLYLSSPAKVTINVTLEGYSIPIAVADTYDVEADTTLTVDAEHGVLANDIDADGDDLTAQPLGGASHGILTLYPDGSFVYIPDTGYVGADYFTYQAFDGLFLSKPVMVTINVISEGNTKPVAVADTYETTINTTLSVDAEHGVLENDFDADGDDLTAQPLGGASHGILTLYADGSFVYLPDADYVGADYFTYQASDGVYLSKPVMVTINVISSGNTKPVAVADTYTAYANNTLVVNAASGVLVNDIDVDGDELTAQMLGGASHGTLTLHTDGSFEYVPNVDYVGADYFTYQVSDGMDVSNPVMVTINVVVGYKGTYLPLVLK